MSFYITLISDSSTRFFPENKISSFITQLPVPIELTSAEWEIGLVDVIYPHTWYNVRPDNNVFGFDLGTGQSEARRIPPGCYETVPDLLKAMTLESHKNIIEFHYHRVTKRVTIKTKKKESSVSLCSGLAELLGFEPGDYRGVVESPFIADPNASFPVIYIYCDVCQPQIVGNVQAPLLKIVKVEGKDGEIVNAHYVRPHYVPVIRKHFQTIQIEMRTNSGDLVPFERGKVILVLHFRMRAFV